MSGGAQEWIVVAVIAAATIYIARRFIVKRRMRACPGCDDQTFRRADRLPVISSEASES